MTRSLRDKLILFVAEGFGSGRIPFAPGTWGSLVGLLWIWVLLLPQNIWVYVGGIIFGFFIAVWIGGEAEKILGVTDPGRIVIDEITAIPLVFWGAFAVDFPHAPRFETFFHTGQWHLPIAAFALFRLFDVWKPLGIRKIQHLPGGWGLVIDDYLAAIPGFFVMLLIRNFS